jgi:predicted HAD superfamily Cof-like phosphohydrolase
LVGQFHTKFGLPTAVQSTPRIISDADFLMRLDLITEEAHELLKAHREGNVVKLADALVDLAWVVMGAAHCCGIPFDEVFAEVARANLQKERSTGDDDPRSTRKSRLDVVKPDGWEPPDVGGILFADGVKKLDFSRICRQHEDGRP